MVMSVAAPYRFPSLKRRGTLVGGAAVALTAWGFFAPAPASAQVPPLPSVPPPSSLTEMFGYVGAVAQSAVVPAGVSLAEV
jgi:hypothetical protein